MAPAAAASASDIDARPHPQHDKSGEQEEVDASAAAQIELADAVDSSKQSSCSENEAHTMHTKFKSSGPVEAEDRQPAGSLQPT